ncbi:MAG: SH3 domain-containing protein [Candidatus Babeliales bacterium]|jgi:hypothetical protein
MLSRIQFLLVALLLFAPGYAQQTSGPGTLFVKANEFYRNGAIKHAYELYQKITPQTPAVHFNLGNCAYRMGNFGMAFVHWRRAEWNWGFHDRESLQHNITLVQEKLRGVPTADEEQPFLTMLRASTRSLYHRTLSYAKSLPILYAQLIFLFLWLICCVGYAYRNTTKIIRYVWCGSIVVFIAFGCLVATKMVAASRQQLIIIKTPANLTSGPQKSGFAALGQLKEGQEADILGESGDFYKIHINSTTGWIDKQVVEKI